MWRFGFRGLSFFSSNSDDGCVMLLLCDDLGARAVVYMRKIWAGSSRTSHIPGEWTPLHFLFFPLNLSYCPAELFWWNAKKWGKGTEICSYICAHEIVANVRPFFSLVKFKLWNPEVFSSCQVQGHGLIPCWMGPRNVLFLHSFSSILWFYRSPRAWAKRMVRRKRLSDPTRDQLFPRS